LGDKVVGVFVRFRAAASVNFGFFWAWQIAALMVGVLKTNFMDGGSST
jgi:hypothetical protein